ncbi:MAG: tryptophan--tRNA ligase [Bacteroidota bacterium]
MSENPSQKKKQVLSCIQPTGDMHYGNYFGAVKNWVDLQEKYDCLYGVVDYHAMTMPYNPDKLRANSWDIVFNLLATGIKPGNLFVQSLIPEHVELGWIFNCFCSYGLLTRMTQFKDKTSQLKETAKEGFVSAGLFGYPVLQAADILIYHADYVPVGKDQEQHLELSRNIANRFNNQVGKEYFVLPETLFTEVPKVASTADPNRKMSKSLGEKHYINIFGEEARIRKQIRSAVTDTGANDMPVNEKTGEREMSPGTANLFSLLKASGQEEAYTVLKGQYNEANLSYGDLKAEVADALTELSAGFRQNKEALKANKKEVKYQLLQSSAEIRKRAQQTLKEVRALTGLLNLKF